MMQTHHTLAALRAQIRQWRRDGASRPSAWFRLWFTAAIITPGLDVLVQEVMAAMTTSPLPRSKFLPWTG